MMSLYNYMIEQAAKKKDYKFAKKLMEHKDSYYHNNPIVIKK